MTQGRERHFEASLPGEWAVFGCFHRWKDRDGGRWHIQVWHPFKRGFILSARGFVR